MIYRNKFTKLLFILFLINFSSILISKEASIDDLKWGANVTENKVVFIFPAKIQEEWIWNNKNTNTSELEYEWSIRVGEYSDKSGYAFGLSKFKFPGIKQRSGRLIELLMDSQNELWQVSDSGGISMGSFGEVEVKNHKVIISSDNLKQISQLFGNKPAYVQMRIRMPGFSISKKVKVTYSQE